MCPTPSAAMGATAVGMLVGFGVDVRRHTPPGTSATAAVAFRPPYRVTLLPVESQHITDNQTIYQQYLMKIHAYSPSQNIFASAPATI